MYKFSFALLLLGSVSLTFAQQSPTTTFKKSAELVTIPVVVTDKAGNPIRGLTRDNFIIHENGKITRSVGTFEAIEIPPATAKPNTRLLPVGEYSNFAVSGATPSRITVVVLDMINTPFTSQARLRKELLKFLAKNLRGDEPTALLTIGRNGVKQIHPFTNDPQLLVKALQKVSGTPSNMDLNETVLDNPSDPSTLTDEEQQLEDFQRDTVAAENSFYQKNAIFDTMAALEQIAQAYSGLPGRKILLWASAGFPFLLEDPKSIIGMNTDMVDSYERAWRALNAANIAVYPIDSEGLINPTYGAFDVTKRNAPNIGPARLGRPPAYNRYLETRATMQSFADATGGKPCLDRNDLATCFDLAEKDSGSYYMLGYYLPEEDRTPGWHKLKVTVNTKHVHVRARSGFYVPDRSRPANESLKAELSNAFSSPLDYTGLQLFARWVGRKNDTKVAGHIKATFEVAILGSALTIDPGDNNHVNFEVAAVAYDEQGKIVGSVSKSIDGHLKPENAENIRKEGLRYQDEIGLPIGKYTMKLVVRDNLAAKMGSVTVPVSVN
jgi:VWFA-related protein